MLFKIKLIAGVCLFKRSDIVNVPSFYVTIGSEKLELHENVFLNEGNEIFGFCKTTFKYEIII